MVSAPDKPVFVIGDTHGHLDRLEALLKKADTATKDCLTIQLGDLGHIGVETVNQDREIWQRAKDGLVDYVLWGNHDRAAVDSNHIFGGFARPDPEVIRVMRAMEAEGRLLMAYAAHGWLITHAGLHAQFKYQKVDIDKTDPGAITDWLNERMRSGETEPVIDAVGRTRFGASPFGGILWRDIAEKLYPGVRQIFGHTASSQHIVRGDADQWYCIDIGGKGGPNDIEAECLAGIWLPSEEIVRVDIWKEPS